MTTRHSGDGGRTFTGHPRVAGLDGRAGGANAGTYLARVTDHGGREAGITQVGIHGRGRIYASWYTEGRHAQPDLHFAVSAVEI